MIAEDQEIESRIIAAGDPPIQVVQFSCPVLRVFQDPIALYDPDHLHPVKIYRKVRKEVPYVFPFYTY